MTNSLVVGGHCVTAESTIVIYKQYGSEKCVLTSLVIYFMLVSSSSVFKKKRKTTEVSEGLFQD